MPNTKTADLRVYCTGLGLALRVTAIASVLMISSLAVFGCSRSRTDEALVVKYLKTMGWTVETGEGSKTIARFPVDVPANWVMNEGPLPTNSYWAIASALSKDVGSGLETYQGQKVIAWVAPLRERPWLGWQRGQPHNLAVVLVKDGHVVGAWLELEGCLLGPSLKGRNLTDITGLTWGDWLLTNGLGGTAVYASQPEETPEEVIRKYFAAMTQANYEQAIGRLTTWNSLKRLLQHNSSLALYASAPDPTCLEASISSASVMSIVPIEGGVYRAAFERLAGGKPAEVRRYRVTLGVTWQPQIPWPNGPHEIDMTLVRETRGSPWRIDDP